jgi:hypothetical protein
MPRRLPALEISPPFDRRISYETRLLLPGFRVFEDGLRGRRPRLASLWRPKKADTQTAVYSERPRRRSGTDDEAAQMAKRHRWRSGISAKATHRTLDEFCERRFFRF